MAETRIECLECKRSFLDANALYNHAKRKHKGSLLFKDLKTQKFTRRDDDEPSLAQIAVEAEIKRASGLELDPLEESLLS